jgi:hypothetical protein
MLLLPEPDLPHNAAFSPGKRAKLMADKIVFSWAVTDTLSKRMIGAFAMVLVFVIYFEDPFIKPYRPKQHDPN